MKLWSYRDESRPISTFSKEDAISLLRLAYLFTGDKRVSELALMDALDYELNDRLESPSEESSRLESLTTSVIGEVLCGLMTPLTSALRRFELALSSFAVEVDQYPSPEWSSEHSVDAEMMEEAILAIDLFPRCVLLLTTFQKYTLEHVASLLGTSDKLAQAAQVIGLTELTKNIAKRQGWCPLLYLRPDMPNAHAVAMAG